MSCQVRILFTDLCACFRPSPDEIDFVLVDARRPSEQQLGAGMHPHKPVLVVRKEDLAVDQDNRRHDHEVPGIDGDVLAIFDLSREVLHMSSRSALEPVHFPAVGEAPATPADATSLSWIASLERLGHDLDALHPACFGDLQTGPVIARVKITGGRTFCRRIIHLDGVPRLWELRAAPSASAIAPRRALGDLIEVQMTADDDELQEGFRITSSQQDLTLRPFKGERLDLVISNQGLAPMQEAQSQATHFRWFYELLRNPPALFERPIPHAVARGELTSGAGSPCPMFVGGFGG